MGVAGGFEILGAFAGRFSCMELSEIEEACAKIGIQIQGKELIDKISDLKNSGHLKVYGYGKSIEVIATQKGREAYRDYRSFILGRMSEGGKHPAAMLLVREMLKEGSKKPKVGQAMGTFTSAA
jgi:hypothetical protein